MYAAGRRRSAAPIHGSRGVLLTVLQERVDGLRGLHAGGPARRAGATRRREAQRERQDPGAVHGELPRAHRQPQLRQERAHRGRGCRPRARRLGLCVHVGARPCHSSAARRCATSALALASGARVSTRIVWLCCAAGAQLSKVTTHLAAVPGIASSLSSLCRQFEDKAQKLRGAHQRIRLTLQHHSQVPWLRCHPTSRCAGQRCAVSSPCRLGRASRFVHVHVRGCACSCWSCWRSPI
jgi:hypothetical protein